MMKERQWLIAMPNSERWDSSKSFDTKELAIVHGISVLTKWNNATEKERREMDLSDDISEGGGIGISDKQEDFEVGKVRYAAFPDATDNLLELISEQAYDEYGEHAEDYLYDVTDDHKKELSNLIADWAKRHNYLPDFFSIIKNEEVNIHYFNEVTE